MEGTDPTNENSNRNKAQTYQMKKVTNGAQTYQIKIVTINERDTDVSNENGNESGTDLPNENRNESGTDLPNEDGTVLNLRNLTTSARGWLQREIFIPVSILMFPHVLVLSVKCFKKGWRLR